MPRRTPTIQIASLLAVAVLALAACSGDDDSDGSAGDSATTAAPGSDSSGDDDGEGDGEGDGRTLPTRPERPGRDDEDGSDGDGEPEDGETGGGGGGSDDTGSTETSEADRPGDDVTPLLEDLDRLATSSFKIDYATSGELGALTTWWKNPRGRADATYYGFGVRVYGDAETGDVTVCVVYRVAADCDTEPGEGYPGLPAILNPASQGEEIARVLEVPGIAVSTRAIAGQEADCAETPGSATAPKQTVCLAHSGALLYYAGAEGTVNGEPAAPLSIEATSYTEGVSDADVTP